MRDPQASSLVESSLASHSTAWIDRWFVGSSRSSTSGLAKRAAASATRTRHPPDSAPRGRASRAAGKPKFSSSFVARSRAESASMASSRSKTPKRSDAAPSALPSALPLATEPSALPSATEPSATEPSALPPLSPWSLSSSSRSSRRSTSECTTTSAGVIRSVSEVSFTSWLT
mmetsp:Transcript_34223/g.77336  ORF Transcript_34223/g.77336 Transcript_34223/m.77336 type:complete len:173 (+) Transcript_34223:1357-1875(+)